MMEDRESEENKPTVLNNFKLVTIIFLSLLVILGCIYGLIIVSKANADDGTSVFVVSETDIHKVPQVEVSETEILFIAESSGTSYIFDIKTSKIKRFKRKLSADGFNVSSDFQISPDGKNVAFCSSSSRNSDKSLMMWDGNDRKIKKIDGVTLRQKSFRLLSDGSGVVYIGNSNFIYEKIFEEDEPVVIFENDSITSTYIFGLSSDDDDLYHCVSTGASFCSDFAITKIYKNSTIVMECKTKKANLLKIILIGEMIFILNDDEKIIFIDTNSEGQVHHQKETDSSFQIEECTKIRNLILSNDGLRLFVQCHRLADENESNYSLIQVKVDDIQDGIVVKVEKELMRQCNGEISMYPSPENIQFDDFEDVTFEEIEIRIPKLSFNESIKVFIDGDGNICKENTRGRPDITILISAPPSGNNEVIRNPILTEEGELFFVLERRNPSREYEIRKLTVSSGNDTLLKKLNSFKAMNLINDKLFVTLDSKNVIMIETCEKYYGLSMSFEQSHGGQDIFMYDPDCREGDTRICDLVLFNYETKTRVYITGQEDDPDIREFVRLNENPQASPDGKVIGFSRSINGGFTHSIMLADRTGLRKLDLPDINGLQFSFTPDSKGIVCVSKNGKQIHRIEMNGNDYTDKLLFEITFFMPAPNFKGIMNPVLLRNDTLVFVVAYSMNEYSVCRLKDGAKSCNSNFGKSMKLIPVGDLVYGFVAGTDVIFVTNTQNPLFDLNHFNIEGFLHFTGGGSASEDGKYLYLNAPIKDYDRAKNVLIKVNVEGITGDSKNITLKKSKMEEVISIDNFRPNFALVPRLRAE